MMRISERARTRRATSLVELLVVIVIFLIGILAIVQIFPGGFRVLVRTGEVSIATQLAERESERVQARPDQMPFEIVPVLYTNIAGNVVIERDPYHSPDELAPAGVGVNVNGQVVDINNLVLGPWEYLSGANNFRRVIGEGGRVPAPSAVGTRFGGVMILQFSPIIYSGFLQGLLQVYGNDLGKMEGTPDVNTQVRDYKYYVENPGENTARLYLPASSTYDRSYRVSFTGLYDSGGKFYRKKIDTSVSIVATATAAYVPVDVSTFAGLAFSGLEINSLEVARNFSLVNTFSADNPYEYQLLDNSLGLLLFNPIGYNYIERGENGERTPLTARADYDVYDWRIIREEFRVPEDSNSPYKLILRNLKVKGNLGPDNRTMTGMNVSVSDGQGGSNIPDFILMDMQTGGVFLEVSATRTDGAGGRKRLMEIDKSAGRVRFIDADDVPGNGLTGELVMPGDNAPTDIAMTGRSVRAMYQAVNEWAVQVTKAADSYSPYVPDTASVRRLASAEYYVGGSGPHYTGIDFDTNEQNYRLYFPPMDANRKVTIAEVWYRLASDPPTAAPKLLANQDFVVQSSPPDPVGLPYVDIRSSAPGDAIFDFEAYGYAVKGVKGASVSVRVLWNGAHFSWGADQARNMEVYNEWARNYRKVVNDGFLTRSSK